MGTEVLLGTTGNVGEIGPGPDNMFDSSAHLLQHQADTLEHMDRLLIRAPGRIYGPLLVNRGRSGNEHERPDPFCSAVVAQRFEWSPSRYFSPAHFCFPYLVFVPIPTRVLQENRNRISIIVNRHIRVGGLGHLQVFVSLLAAPDPGLDVNRNRGPSNLPGFAIATDLIADKHRQMKLHGLNCDRYNTTDHSIACMDRTGQIHL